MVATAASADATCHAHLFLISLPSSTAADGGLPAASPAFSRSWSLPCPGRRFLQHDTPMRPKCTKNRMPNKPLVIQDSSTIVVRHSLPGMAGSDSLAPLAYTAQHSTAWHRMECGGSQRGHHEHEHAGALAMPKIVSGMHGPTTC